MIEFPPERDEKLDSVSGFISALTEEIEVLGDSELGQQLSVSEMTINMPVEMKVGGGHDTLDLEMGPVGQRTLTSVLPVWHQIRLRVVIYNDNG